MMYRILRFLGIGMDCLSSMILLTPAAMLVQKLSGRKIRSAHTLFVLLYVCTLAGIFSVTGLPNIRNCSIDLTVNYIPMVDVLDSPMQYLLNILMFVPIGFLLPLLWKRYGDWKHLLGFGGLFTLFIEIAQVFTFRATDIDDLISNLLGAGIGFLLVRLMGEKLKVPLPVAEEGRHAVTDSPWFYLAIAFLINFFVQPYWSAFFWDSLL